MTFRKLYAYLFASTMALFGVNVVAEEGDSEAADGDVEEVLVTGSYIRRDNFDLPSPKSTIDSDDIALSGNAEIGDVIFDQSFQLGVNANAAPFEGICCGLESSDGLGTSTGWGENTDNQQGNQGTEVWANLRGLGTRATMTMMDGHRLPADTTQRGERAGVDVSGMYPTIAIGRVETILDGASALYGAEAVSGVINMVPRKDFEGFEISVDYSQPFEDGAPNQSISFLGGVQGERGRAIFSMELRETDRMRFTDRPKFIIDTKNPWQRFDASQNEASRFYPQTSWSRFWKDAYNVGGNPASRFGTVRRDDQGIIYDTALTGSVAGRGNDQRQSGGQFWSDNVGFGSRTVVKDPSCGHAFGSGFSDSGPEPSAGGPYYGFNDGTDEGPGGQRSQWEDQFGPASGTGFRNTYGETFIYNDIGKHGNFLNGYTDPNDPANHCRMVDSDIQDLQAESTRNKGMAYFEYDVNDNITLRGELVAGTVDYNTRLYAPAFNDFDLGNGVVNDRMAIAVGSNPGNPFRAFADGSTTDTYVTLGDGWDPTFNNWYEFPGTSQTSEGWLRTVQRQLDFDDVNNNGRYEYLSEPGELLVFAQDANGDGIPDRGTCSVVDGCTDADLLHDPRLNRNPGYRVMVMDMGDSDGDGIPNRFDPDSGGIPLYEDVRFGDGELFAFPKNPRNNNLDWAHNDGVLSYLRRTQRQDLRIRLGGEFRIPDSEWIIDADWIWSKGVRETNQPQEVTNAMVDALRCNAGPNNDSCWNPFGTTYLMMDENGFVMGNPDIRFPAANDPGWTPADHEYTNTEEEHRNAGVVMQYDTQDLQMTLVDLVASNGSLFDLWYNDAPVGFAIGAHWRLEEEEFRPHALNQAAIGGPKIGLRTSEQESRAVFAELSIPIMQSDTFGEMEAQIALRYTEITAEGIIGQPGTAKFDTTIPKLAIRYAPTDWLAIRGSITEGFVTPGLFSLFGEESLTTTATVRDYICDLAADIQDCIDAGAGTGGGTPNVRTANAGNADLDPETSDLYNIGASLRLLDGDLVFDVDYTSVEFRGQIEQIDAATHVNLNENGFTAFLQSSCPGTIVDWDNGSKHTDANMTAMDPITWRNSSFTNQADLDCRRNAAINWIQTGANAGAGEQAFSGAALERGANGSPITLNYVEAPFTAQGAREAETIIYGARYGFELPDHRLTDWMGDDKGAFMFTMSATQFLTQSLMKFKSFGCDDEGKNSGGFCNIDNVFAGITTDGVGNRNSQYFSPPGMELYSNLPPTPEYRINATLRWFKGPHMAQLGVRWHDSVTNINVAWDQMLARDAQDPRTVVPAWTWDGVGEAGGIYDTGLNNHGYPHFVRGVQNPNDTPQSEKCAYQPWPVCKLPAEAYWDLSYSYRTTDVFGLSSMTFNVGIRNIFDNYPQAITQFSGHEPYLDNIMGRNFLVRLNFGL